MQLRMGNLPGSQAAGRLFCALPQEQLNVVWTQNDGNLLGWLSGAPHEDAYAWWVAVRHNIVLPGTGTNMGGM
jgi:hypothetical protein